MSPARKSLLIKLIHTLLSSKERVHHLVPAASALCWCGSGEEESYKHLFFQCRKNCDAGKAVLSCIQSYDRNLTVEKALRLELEADDPFLLPSACILAAGLGFIWERRKEKYGTSVFEMRTELELSVSIRRRSRSRMIREAASIMENMIDNFFI